MVLQLCDRVTVMVTGSVLYSGTPSDVRNHPDVLEAYIGTHAEHPEAEHLEAKHREAEHREAQPSAEVTAEAVE